MRWKTRNRLCGCLGAVVLLGGCGLSGTWRTDAIPSEQTAFPITHITFNGDGRFTATAHLGANTHTTTGTYRWNGRTLKIAPDNGPTRIYTGRMTLDGALRLSYQGPDKSTTATLQRVDQAAPARPSGSQ